MSEMFEGIVVRANATSASQAFKQVHNKRRLGLGELAAEVYAIYVDEGRDVVFNEEEDRRLAALLSSELGKSVVVLYDNSIGLNSAALFVDGRKEQDFTEADAMWVLLNEKGDRVMDYVFNGNQLETEKEYECIRSPIDAGLEALGVPGEIRLPELKEAFCYKFYDEPI